MSCAAFMWCLWELRKILFSWKKMAQRENATWDAEELANAVQRVASSGLDARAGGAGIQAASTTTTIWSSRIFFFRTCHSTYFIIKKNKIIITNFNINITKTVTKHH